MNGAWITLLLLALTDWRETATNARAICVARLAGVSGLKCTSDEACVREASRRLRGACPGLERAYECQMRGPPAFGVPGVPHYCGCGGPLTFDTDAQGHRRYHDGCH